MIRFYANAHFLFPGKRVSSFHQILQKPSEPKHLKALRREAAPNSSRAPAAPGQRCEISFVGSLFLLCNFSDAQKAVPDSHAQVGLEVRLHPRDHHPDLLHEPVHRLQSLLQPSELSLLLSLLVKNT